MFAVAVSIVRPQKSLEKRSLPHLRLAPSTQLEAESIFSLKVMARLIPWLAVSGLRTSLVSCGTDHGARDRQSESVVLDRDDFDLCDPSTVKD